MLTHIVPQPGVTDFVELGMWAVKYLLTSMPPPLKKKIQPPKNHAMPQNQASISFIVKSALKM